MSFIISLDTPHFNMDGDPLVWTDLGVQRIIELQTTGPVVRSIMKTEVHLVTDGDTMIQGKRARDILVGHTLKTLGEGDAKVKAVRGRVTLTKAGKPRKGSVLQGQLYEINITQTIHGVLINE